MIVLIGPGNTLDLEANFPVLLSTQGLKSSQHYLEPTAPVLLQVLSCTRIELVSSDQSTSKHRHGSADFIDTQEC
jgi:hypothetical protein